MWLYLATDVAARQNPTKLQTDGLPALRVGTAPLALIVERVIDTAERVHVERERYRFV